VSTVDREGDGSFGRSTASSAFAEWRPPGTTSIVPLFVVGGADDSKSVQKRLPAGHVKPPPSTPDDEVEEVDDDVDVLVDEAGAPSGSVPLLEDALDPLRVPPASSSLDGP